MVTCTKRNLYTLPNRNVPDAKEKRMDWMKSIADSAVNNMAFLDESGVNTNMTRHYARALKQKRAVDSTPVNTPASTTILSSIRLNGETAYITYQGGTSAERFANYLETTLLPGLSENDIVIMDNMRSHHANLVKKVLEDKHIHYLYLPPYSPDLNPIEKMWSKIKAFLRKKKERNASNLPKAIEQAFSTVRQSDCEGWFRSCGYLR